MLREEALFGQEEVAGIKDDPGKGHIWRWTGRYGAKYMRKDIPSSPSCPSCRPDWPAAAGRCDGRQAYCCGSPWFKLGSCAFKPVGLPGQPEERSGVHLMLSFFFDVLVETSWCEKWFKTNSDRPVCQNVATPWKAGKRAICSRIEMGYTALRLLATGRHVMVPAA